MQCDKAYGFRSLEPGILDGFPKIPKKKGEKRGRDWKEFSLAEKMGM
jgi:hypothetical protein